MSSQFQDVRAQLESDEQLKILMAGLRGSNLNDSDYAEEGVNMVMVEVSPHCSMHGREKDWTQRPLSRDLSQKIKELCPHGRLVRCDSREQMVLHSQGRRCGILIIL